MATMPVTGTNDVWEGMRFGWMDGHPSLAADGSASEVVEVWASRRVRQARWDGESWVDELTGEVMVGVTHWRVVRV